MPSPRIPDRLNLPQVTLCAVTSVNIVATLRALEASLAQVDFADCLLFTDAKVPPDHPSITVVPIQPLASAQAYSEFLIGHLADHIATPHCLIVQWDGHVLDARRWDPAFLEYDFIGASWPQFADGHDVGNGGFSLRSRRLLQACQSPRFEVAHPEDIMIGRTHRPWLEDQGFRFAPRELADRFSTERAGNLAASFGYHGAWHMPDVLGAEEFWAIYRTLDERTSIRHDINTLARLLWRGKGGVRRAARLLLDRVADALNGRKTAC